MKIDTHCHTTYSRRDDFLINDALNTPREMIKSAIKKGLDGIAITDHNNIKGSLIGKKEAKKLKKDFIVITGVEIKTLSGEILALGIKEKIPNYLSIEETIDKIHDLNGITIAAHPFGENLMRKCVKNEAIKADAIEVFNARNIIKGSNEKALKLANKFNKPKTAGSDAHWYKDIGNAGIICNTDPMEEILKGKVKIFGKYTPFSDFVYVNAFKFLRAIKWNILRK